MKLDSRITVHREELTEREWRKLLTRLTFTDAEGLQVSAFQYRNGSGAIEMPRGALDMLPSHLEIRDLRTRPAMPKIAYRKQLDAPDYEGQTDAIVAMFRFEQGQIIAPPGRGKTEVALAFAAASRTRVLVIVHTYDLFKQWCDRAAVSVPGMKLGVIRGQRCDVGHLTIAMAQTLRQYIRAGRSFWQQFGAVIVDEGHHAAADTWEWLLNVCPAFYRFGMSASEKRSDGRQALVRFNIGPVIYKIKFESQVPMVVVPVKTGFKTRYNGQQYTRILQELVKDRERNRRIAELVTKEIEAGNSVLALSRQIVHLNGIYSELDPKYAAQAVVVTGKLNRHDRDKYIGQLRDGSLRCILGTQLFEEGVDVPRLNRIILAFPGTEITALQKVGRGSRKFEGKVECIVYDMLDDLVRVLAKQYLRRKTWYQSVGIKVAKINEEVEDDTKPEASKGRKLLAQIKVARPSRD